MRLANRKERRASASISRKPSAAWDAWERRAFAADELRGTAMEHMRCAYVNAIYSVQVYECDVPDFGAVTHLAIRRHDGAMSRSWSHLQRIKNELVGADRLGVEVFPPAGDLVDQADMQHLWVLPVGFEFAFGLTRFAWGRPVGRRA